MPKQYKVDQGEHVPGIAKQLGFSDYRKIWNFGPNSDLRDSLHREPTLLFPGDVLSIPDIQIKNVDAATERLHKFKIAIPVLLLQVVVRDLNDEPFAGESYNLQISSGLQAGTADPNGMTSDSIAWNDHDANLRFPAKKVRLRLRIGDLNPLVENPSTDEQIAGWQVRLNNLAYSSGFTPTNRKQLRWAIEEFQRDHGWDPDKGKKPNGNTDTETRDKLAQVHGC